MADSLVAPLLASRPTDWGTLSVAGLIAASRGDSVRAEHYASQLAALGTRLQHGAPTLGRARIAALLGRKDDAVQLVREARAEGALITDLHLYPEFHVLRGYSPFEALITPIG